VKTQTDGWVSALVELGEDFFPWTPTAFARQKNGSRCAISGLLQAELIDSSRKPKKLVELFREKGTDSVLGWELVWFALANNASLIKWFVTDVEFGVSFTQDELTAKLSNYFPSPWSFDHSRRTLCVKGHIVKIAVGLGRLRIGNCFAGVGFYGRRQRRALTL
jgi:hypothetical protein